MYWLVDDDPDQRFTDEQELAEWLIPDDSRDDDYEGFNDYLNYEYGSITVCGFTYDASDILDRMDSDEYASEMSDWAEREVESLRDSTAYDLRNITPGDYEYVEGYRVYAYNEDEDEAEEVAEAVAAVEEAAALAEFSAYEALVAIMQEEAEKQKEAEKEQAQIGDDFMSLMQTIG